MMKGAMRVVAFIGRSNSGKTTLICGVVVHFVARGLRVAAIKHTHHPLNEEHRGDTGRFLDAGAMPVILAGEREAVVFEANAARRIAIAGFGDLLQSVGEPDLVLVEGFKEHEGCPRIDAERVRGIDEAIELLDRIA